MSNLTEQIQAADANADFYSAQIIVPQQDGSTEDMRIKLKAEIVKELMPGVDWKKYEKLAEDLKLKNVEEKIKNPPPVDPMADQYGQQSY